MAHCSPKRQPWTKESSWRNCAASTQPLLKTQSGWMLVNHLLSVPSKVLHGVPILLASRRFALLVTLLAVGLALPALRVGWLLDDYYHRAVLTRDPHFADLFGPPEDMFRFLRGDPERTARMMDLGFLPWWTYRGLKAEFLQSLTVLTHRLDYWLWPDSPEAMHAHSLLWFAALVFLTACLYRRIITPPWLSGLAALLFAVDDVHATPAAWIANRNSLVAGCFGVLALILHDRWRREGKPTHLAMAVCSFAAALLAKEEGIAAFAYLVAYGLILDSAGWRRGGMFVVPYFVVIVAWRFLRTAWGYGVWDMGLYVDPLHDPTRFAGATIERLPVLLLAQLASFPSDVGAILSPAGRMAVWWCALLFLGLFAIVAVPRLRSDRVAAFWAAGMLLSAVPVCATFPMDRLLTFVSIGAFGLLAQFAHAVFAFGRLGQPSWWRLAPALILASCLVVVHALFAPIALTYRTANPAGPKRRMQSFMAPTLDDASVTSKSVVIVNAPSSLHAGYLPILASLKGQPMPMHTRVLAPGIPSVLIRRTEINALTIHPRNGYLDWVADRLVRDSQHLFAVGEEVRLSDMVATVTQLTADGRPAEVAFRFSAPLEDPSLYWLCYRENTFQPFIPPAVGQSIQIDIGGFLGDQDFSGTLPPAAAAGGKNASQLADENSTTKEPRHD